MYWQHFAKQSSDLLCVVDEDKTYLWVNPRWAQTTGWREEQMLGRAFIDFMHPEDRSEAAEVFGRIVASTDDEELFEYTGRYQHADGHYIWLEWSASSSSNGRVYGTARDVSARIAREHERAQWVNLFEAYEERTGMGRWSTDLRTGESNWSSSMARDYGDSSFAEPFSFERGMEQIHPDGKDLRQSVLERYPDLEQRLHFMTGDSWSLENHDFLLSLGRPHLDKPFVVSEIKEFVETTCVR